MAAIVTATPTFSALTLQRRAQVRNGHDGHNNHDDADIRRVRIPISGPPLYLPSYAPSVPSFLLPVILPYQHANADLSSLLRTARCSCFFLLPLTFLCYITPNHIFLTFLDSLLPSTYTYRPPFFNLTRFCSFLPFQTWRGQKSNFYCPWEDSVLSPKSGM